MVAVRPPSEPLIFPVPVGTWFTVADDPGHTQWVVLACDHADTVYLVVPKGYKPVSRLTIFHSPNDRLTELALVQASCPSHAQVR
jgi:hypothetical protein